MQSAQLHQAGVASLLLSRLLGRPTRLAVVFVLSAAVLVLVRERRCPPPP